MTAADDDDSQLQALKGFADAEEKEIVGKLEDILTDVAKTGQYIFPWHFMKPLYYHKLDMVTTEFLTTHPPKNQDGSENQQAMSELKNFREELLETFDKFALAPFTLQRVTELLLQPRKHYKTTSKFFRGLGKNIMVVSTLEMAETEERNKLKRQYEDANGKSEYEMPPMKRMENGSVFYSYGGPNSLNYNDLNHGYMDEEHEETFADVCDGEDCVEEQVNGYVTTVANATVAAEEQQQNTEVTIESNAVLEEAQAVTAVTTTPAEEVDEAEADLTSNESMEGS